MFGSQSAWYFRTLAGINLARDSVAWNGIVIHPHIDAVGVDLKYHLLILTTGMEISLLCRSKYPNAQGIGRIFLVYLQGHLLGCRGSLPDLLYNSYLIFLLSHHPRNMTQLTWLARGE